MTKRHERIVAQETAAPDPVWCEWCEQRPADGRLPTIDQDTEREVSDRTVLMCESCGGHFHGGTAKDRPGDCHYDFELLSEASM